MDPIRITNPVPLTSFLGFNDQSKTVVPVEPEQFPDMLVKGLIMSKRGPSDDYRVASSDAAKIIYGDDLFDETSPFYTHQNKLLDAMGQNAWVMYQRLIMPNAKKATATLYVHLTTTDQFRPYKRNSDGKVVFGGDGAPEEQDEAINGAEICFSVVKGLETNVLTEGDTRSFPVMQLEAGDYGKDYEHIGISIGQIDSYGINNAFLTKDGFIPYEVKLVDKIGAKSTVINTIGGASSIFIGMKKGIRDPYTKEKLYLDTKFKPSYFNTDREGLPFRDIYANLKMLDDNYLALLSALAEVEMPYISDEMKTWEDGLQAATTTWTRMDGVLSSETPHLFNPFAAKYPNEIPYYAVKISNDLYSQIDNAKPTQSITSDTPFFLQDGSDGDVSYENYEKAVQTHLSRYADKLDPVLDMAYNVESTFLDSGFTMPTKEYFPKVWTNRPDTDIIFCTVQEGIDNEKEESIEEMRTSAKAINAFTKRYPESVYFGTGVTRGIIIGGNGEVIDDSYDGRLTQAYDFIRKCSKFFGAGNGKWISDELFDIPPKSIVTEMKNLSPKSIPDVLLDSLVTENLVFTTRYNTKLYQYPMIPTLQEDPTSVFNKFFTMKASCSLTKIGAAARREFSGAQRFTRAQLKQRIEAFVMNAADGKYADLITVAPVVTYTELDKLRNYSWALDIKVSGGPFFTAQTFSITGVRTQEVN